MKLCFACDEYPPGPHGGIGSLVQIMARGLAGAGHDVRVAGLYPASYPAPDYEEDGGVRVWRLRLPAGRRGWIGARIRLYRLIRRWVASGDVDLVEVPDYGAPAAFWPGLAVPVVARLSGSTTFFRSEMGRPADRGTRILERASLRRADFILSESRYLEERTRAVFSLGGEPGDVIYNPVDLPAPGPAIPRERFSVMFAGTLTEKKGIVSLVRAWPAVARAHPGALLHIWGKDGIAPAGGSMQTYLGTLIPTDLAATVVYHGHVPLEKLLGAFRTAGMAVLPSYAEGFALTPLHAMAAGCPVVYTKRGSGPELITDGVTGLLVDPDSPEEIASAICRLLGEPAGADRIGDAGRLHVEKNFSRATILAQNERYYLKCLARFGADRHTRKKDHGNAH